MSDHTQTIPADLDFAGADDASLEQGIESAGKALANKYIVRYPNLYAKTVAGNVYRLPLTVTANYFDDNDDDLSPLEQIRKLLLRENPRAEAKLDTEATVSLLGIADKYADIIQSVQLASLGKYEPSGEK